MGPDDAFSSVPYMKGSTFLRYLEDLLGGPEVFEPFLKFYLNKYKYQSIVTQDFKSTLYDYFNEPKYNLEAVDWELWLNGTGMPPVIPKYDMSLVDAATKHSKLWAESSVEAIKSSPIISESLLSVQVIEVLSQLLASNTIVDLNADKINLLASVYKINGCKNAEIRFRYLRLCIKAQLEDKIGEIIEFADSNFRMKFCRSVYRELGAWPKARPIAIANFEKVRDQMMKVCANQVAKDLGI